MPSPNQEATSFHKTSASVLLDLTRGIAAILVLLSHWKIMFFVDYPMIPSHRIWFAIPYVICDAGHQSVLIFFVLSGYLISGSILRSVVRGEWRWSSYLVHRFVRLWVVLIPALLLGALWDWIGLHYSNSPILYQGITPKSHLQNVSHSLTPAAFVGNIAFLQTLLVPAFGSNDALWSLANEFWYYLLFPLGLFAVRRGYSPVLRAVFAILFLAIAWFTRVSILPLFPVWLAGYALTRLPAPRCGLVMRITAAIAYVPLVFLFAKKNFLPSLAQDYLFGFITFLFFWILLSARQPAGAGSWVSFSRQIARCSYTMYAVHMPALLLVTAFIAGDRLWSPTDLPHTAVALAVLAALLAYTWFIASLTEFHTDSLRAFIERHLTWIQKARISRQKRNFVGAAE
jgi:peptidoglycan/LPS O-acetylase OafA/YrhL